MHIGGLSRPGTGQLNAALRWMSTDNQGFIFERPPARVKINFHQLYANDETGLIAGEAGKHFQYDVWVPWTVYGVRFANDQLRDIQSLRVFGRPNQLMSTEDALKPLYIPNVSQKTGECCTTKDIHDLLHDRDEGAAYTVTEALAVILGSFWSSDFNTDITRAQGDFWEPKDLEEWAVLSLEQVLQNTQSDSVTNLAELCLTLEGAQPEDFYSLWYNLLVKVMA